MNRNFICTCIAIGMAVTGWAQQDPLYNLYHYNQSMINPAYAGIYKNLSLNLISRQQWVGIEGAPVTHTLSAASSLGERVGTGLMIVQDQLGINTTSEVQLAFSYKVIHTKNQTLSFGMQGGLVSYRYDYSKLNLEYIDDEDLDLTRTQFQQPNVGAGLFYYRDNFYLGISSPRILNVQVGDGVTSSTRYQRHYYLSGGIVLNNKMHNKIRLKPSFLLRMAPEGNYALDVNMHALFADVLWAGVTVRNFSAVGVNGQLQVNQQLRIGYAFELPTSRLVSRNFGTHELSLMLELGVLKRQQRVTRYF